MISYQFMEHGKPLQKVLQDTPKPQGTEVLVRITRSGVCHSDLHIWDGYFDWGGGKKFYVKDRGCVPPFTLGHEPFGIVEDFGSAVSRIDKKLKRGQNFSKGFSRMRATLHQRAGVQEQYDRLGNVVKQVTSVSRHQAPGFPK